jgi:hypothetical protein
MLGWLSSLPVCSSISSAVASLLSNWVFSLLDWQVFRPLSVTQYIALQNSLFAIEKGVLLGSESY